MESIDTTTVELGQLQEAIKTPEDGLRPIIISLNGDNSWLWSFPRPTAEREKTGKAYFHIVFEPWLNGPTGLTGLLGPWLVWLNLAAPPAASTADDVDALVRRIEEIWASCHGTGFAPSEGDDGEVLPLVDAILLGFHYPDHLHPPSLLMFDQRIPVIATFQGAPIVKALKHFDTISLIQDMTDNVSSWQHLHHPEGLPEWLNPVRMPGHHELNYLFALIWSRKLTEGGEEIHEAVYQSPHGLLFSHPQGQTALQKFLTISHREKNLPQPLALFHGLKESRAAGMMNTFGASAGLQLWRILGEPKSWVVSHDSALQYAGLVMWMFWVYDTPRTIEWALGSEKESVEGKEGPKIVNVESGQAFVL